VLHDGADERIAATARGDIARFLLSFRRFVFGLCRGLRGCRLCRLSGCRFVPVLFGTAAVDCAGFGLVFGATVFANGSCWARTAALVAGAVFAGAVFAEAVFAGAAVAAAAGLAVAVEGLAAAGLAGDF